MSLEGEHGIESSTVEILDGDVGNKMLGRRKLEGAKMPTWGLGQLDFLFFVCGVATGALRPWSRNLGPDSGIFRSAFFFVDYFSLCLSIHEYILILPAPVDPCFLIL